MFHEHVRRRHARRTLMAGAMAAAALAIAAPSAPADAIGSQAPLSTTARADDEGGYAGRFADVAYDAQTGEHLAVWNAGRFDSEADRTFYEIQGQRVDGSGQPVGAVFTISSGEDAADGDMPPSVTWNATRNEFLVVWKNSHDEEGLGQVIAQRVGPAGELLGGNAVISTEGHGYLETPEAVWSPQGGEYLVAWKDARAPGQVYGRLLDGDAAPKGDQLQLSDVVDEDDGPGAHDAISLTYNSRDGEFLVTWRGTDSARGPSRVDEVWGQRIALDGSPVGSRDFRISYLTPDETAPLFNHDRWYAMPPRVIYNANANQYLVAWSSDGPFYVPEIVYATGRGRFERPPTHVYAQRLAADGSRLGDNFPVSSAGLPDGEDTPYWLTYRPDLAYSPASDRYLVAFHSQRGETDAAEIYGRMVGGDGTVLGTDNFQISEMGAADGGFGYRAAVDYNSRTCDFLAAWDGRPASGEVPVPRDAWARRVSAPACPPPAQPAAVAASAPGAVAAPSRRPALGRIALSGVPRACTSARRLSLRIAVRSTTRVRSLTVHLDGRRIASVKNRASVRVRIDAKRLSMRRHRLTVTTRNAAGTTKRTATFRRCAVRVPRFAG